MKVYIVYWEPGYDGGMDICGVFSDLETATSFIEKKSESYDGIVEYTVDNPKIKPTYYKEKTTMVKWEKVV
jgi:hypothetical protein